jgi:hypothetical protein
LSVSFADKGEKLKFPESTYLLSIGTQLVENRYLASHLLKQGHDYQVFFLAKFKDKTPTGLSSVSSE